MRGGLLQAGCSTAIIRHQMIKTQTQYTKTNVINADTHYILIILLHCTITHAPEATCELNVPAAPVPLGAALALLPEMQSAVWSAERRLHGVFEQVSPFTSPPPSRLPLPAGSAPALFGLFFPCL